MQTRAANEMAVFVINKIKNFFGAQTKTFTIFNVVEDISHLSFCINFEAYNYFIILFSYEKGMFGCGIQMNDYVIPLENSQKWWQEANFDVFLEELKKELELRIPDKFLKAKGWYKEA